MRLDQQGVITTSSDAPDSARAAEVSGAAGWFVSELQYDPFVAAALAARATRHIDIGTAIAVAFARTPMTTAYSAHDVQALSGGRFVLGLGSQIRAHITRRFSMEWSRPAARMREYIHALRAIWASWRDGTELDFRGDFYEHTLMTPFFTPEPHGHGDPLIALAAVGPLMTQVAGEVADILMTHPFTTYAYLTEETLPRLHDGAAAAGRDPDKIDVLGEIFVVTGRDERERARVATAVRAQIGFYASTPAYRGVLEKHGWDDLQPELTTLSKQDRWGEMGDLIDDTMLAELAVVVDDPDRAGPAVTDRWGGVLDRFVLYPTWQPDDKARAAMGDHLASYAG